MIKIKYYLLINKSDDYGNCKIAIYYGYEKNIKRYVYFYKEIPKTHYEILNEYVENINEIDFKEYDCNNLKEYLQIYFE